MAPQTTSEIRLASISVAKDSMSFQTQRRGSLKAASSWANPWNEPLQMNPIRAGSLPERLEEYDDANHSKRRQERTSYHTTQSPASVFPSVKRSGWLSFITASFRPSIHRQHLLSFESLTKIRCFGEILIRLMDDSVNKVQWLKCRGYESPLHFLLQYRPPLTVVNAVIFELKQLGQTCPEALCDSKGRNSLHIACATVPSNSVAVIARLLNGQTIRSTSNPAAIADKQRMLPLHHACDGKVTKSDLESRVLIIRFLAQCFPQGVLYLNHRGMTPSDLARKNGNHPEILMILYQTLVDQRKAASANKTKSIDVFSNNTLNSDMVQKYTKSEHRRDGLAAFVQSANDPLTNARNSRLSYSIEKDDIGDFASMDIFGCIGDESVESADDAKSSYDTNKGVNPMHVQGKADLAVSDDVSELDSIYTFGFIADDYSAIEEAVSLALSKEEEKHLPVKKQQQLSELDEESIVNMIANEETITETSENDDSVMEYLHGPLTTDKNGGHEGTILDDTMEYSSSETDNDEIGTGSNTESTNSLSKYFDTQKLQPLLPDVDTSSVSMNSFVFDTSSMVVTPSTSESDGASIMSLTAKKFVQFNDCVQIFKILTLPFSDDDDDDENCKSKDMMDHTDPTESETSATSSSNPLDDSDRGSSSSVMTISEVAATTPSLKMLRYRHCNGVQQLPAHQTNKNPKAENRRGSSTDTTSLFFL